MEQIYEESMAGMYDLPRSPAEREIADKNNMSTPKKRNKSLIAMYVVNGVFLLIIIGLSTAFYLDHKTTMHSLQQNCPNAVMENPTVLPTHKAQSIPEVTTNSALGQNYNVTSSPLYQETTRSTSSPTATCAVPLESCLALRNEGTTKSGFYVIQPKGSNQHITVYCDMVSSGGGWTLVAMISEDNIKSECSSGDVWFSHGSSSGTDTRNWENYNVFQSASFSTNFDYKSPAYFQLQASNVMVQHSMKNSLINETKPFIQYETTNNFLDSFGGNLYNLYTVHYPLNPKPAFYFDVDKILNQLVLSASEVSSLIPDFYNYQYGTHPYHIRDTMFTGYGMQMQFYAGNECSNSMQYGIDMRCQNYNIAFSSRKSHPFFALGAIGNIGRVSQTMYLRVINFRPNTDEVASYNGSISHGNFVMYYKSDCRYNTTLPSVCDVFFTISNKKEWFSGDDVRVDRSSVQTRSNYYLSYLYAQHETWSNILVGYTMFSRTGGRLVTEVQLRNAMNKILAIVAGVGDIVPGCKSTDGLVVPITFSVGKNALNSSIPPSIPKATSGYLQFRSYGMSGSAYAMCPGVKVNNCYGEFACIGGVMNSTSTYKSDCNDFLNWDGFNSNTVLNSSPNDFAHSKNDINSTIMMFYK